MNALTSLPTEVQRSAQRGELQKVVAWLNKGGTVGALCSFPSARGRPSTTTLLQTAAANGHLAMVRELLKRGASVDLPTRLGVTPLMAAAYYGHLSIVLRLLHPPPLAQPLDHLLQLAPHRRLEDLFGK